MKTPTTARPWTTSGPKSPQGHGGAQHQVDTMTGRAEELKSKGNACFQDSHYDKARRYYLDALKAAMEEGADNILHTIYGNLAHVCNKLGTYKESEKYARLAIRKKPDWHKGYHRAALAAKNLGKLDDAIALLDKGIDNCVVNEEMRSLRDTIVELKKKPKGASKPPPPPPLLRADQQPAAAAAAPRAASKTRAAKTTKATKASKAAKSSSATAAAAAASGDQGVWSGLLAASKPAEVVSEQTAAAARAGQPDALSEELRIIVRRGSVALQRPGGGREAYDEYRRALQLVAKYPKELNLSGNELISLRYCYAMSCHEVATLDALNSAEEELLAIIQKTKRPMPAAFYLLGLVYMTLNRFEQASSVLQMASDILSKDARGDTHVYPGTSEVIPDTERAWRGTLRQPVQELLRQCQYPPRADALCRLDDCLSRVTVPDVRNPKQTHQQTRRTIYYRDVDFAGFIKVQCLFKCRLEFHPACWRQLKERFGPETQRTTDKDLLNTPCLTPDCESNICRIVTVDANGLEKHEILSDEYKRRQQKQPHKQLSKQQKKQAAQAQKKHQLAKGRKHKDSLPPPSDDGDSQRQSAEPAVAAAVSGAVSDSAGAAAAAAAAASPAAAQEPAPPRDLREMTVLRRGSITDEVPVGKKSKKKKKGSSSRQLRRRPAAEGFWQAQEEEEVYNGPPVNVIYNTSQDDLASRLGQLEDMRTLEFSTRSLIPDSSVQPACVPRDDQSGEEAHAMVESAYQYLYDYLKGRGPTSASDPSLLKVASELPSHCQELIAQYGSLESFLTRLPRFYQLDGLLCVEVDVGVAEAMLGSVISELISVDVPSPVRPPPPAAPPAAAADGGVSDADTAELEPGGRSDPDDSDAESESESEEEETEEAAEDDGGQLQNGTLHTALVADASEADPDFGAVDPDSADPDSLGLDGDSAGVDGVDSAGVDGVDSAGVDGVDSAEVDGVDSAGVDGVDSAGVDGVDSAEVDGVEELEQDGADAGRQADGDSGAGARGDGVWNTDVEISDDDGGDSLSQVDPSDETGTIALLKQQMKALTLEKTEQAEQLGDARICQLRLERTVRQMSQRAGPHAAPADAEEKQEAAQQLVDTRQQLAETQGRLAQAHQQRADALKRGAELQQQLAGSQQQLASSQQQLQGSQQQLQGTQQQLVEAQQQLAAYQQHQQQLEMQVADQQQQLMALHEQAQDYELQLTGSQQHVAVLEQQAEEFANQLSQQPTVDPEQLQQLQRQLEAESSGRQQAEAALAELRGVERRTRGQYVTMLSRAGTAHLDAASGRCSDAISSAQRLAASSGRPDSALPTVTRLQEALAALEQTRSQFKEAIKKACKAIARKETIDIQSLKLPEIPAIVETALSGPTGRLAAHSSPAGSAAGSAAGSTAGSVRSAASPRPSSRPSSVVTVSSGSGSELGRVSPSPPPAPPPTAAARAKTPAGGATASLRVPAPGSPRRTVTPAALQLSAASKQAGPTTFDSLVGEIEQQFGGVVPGGRDAIIRQFTTYRRRRGGALRGAARDQIVSEVTAMIRAEAAGPASATAASSATAWVRPAGNANGVRPEAPAAQPASLFSVPSKEECVMCRESYSTSQAHKLQCGHELHELCLRRWLRANGYVATCPICRHPFTSDVDFPSL